MNVLPESPYLPEGFKTKPPVTYDTETLLNAMRSRCILEGLVIRCDSLKNLYISAGRINCVIPAKETAIGANEGKVKDIAIISLVGKTVCFKVLSVNLTNPQTALLSRRLAQEEALRYFMARLRPGDVIPCVVTHLARFGAFVDIGCGIISMIGIENISAARILHPLERFYSGQKIYAVILRMEAGENRIFLTHKELLGTWLENAAHFSPGDTVTGIIRGIKPYGLFIELRPNLSGLTEYSSEFITGEAVSVYIKSITPEKMKVKLALIDRVSEHPQPSVYDYSLHGGHIDRWVYSPENSERLIETVFDYQRR